jgi:methenyltetrahydrofolate cyclohydrolase
MDPFVAEDVTWEPGVFAKEDEVQDESIGDWLDQLASAAPAPGGGGAAALETAMAAALVEMVCNLTIGKPAYAEHEATMISARDRAQEQRQRALVLVDEDAAAFRAVIEAYRLPKDTETDAAERTERIQLALAGAADVPRQTALAAATVIDLAESIVAGANPNVVSDIGAAAASARAALETARVNIEVNSGSIADPRLQESLAESVRELERDLLRADALLALVREQIAG